MTPESDIYRCPICEKSFDRKDKLFDFAIASHEKDHRVDRNELVGMIRYDDASLMWVCKLCGDPIHIGEYSARVAVVAHAQEKHGQAFGSSAPVTARGGRSGGSRSGFSWVAEAIGDATEAVVNGIGSVLGKLD